MGNWLASESAQAIDPACAPALCGAVLLLITGCGHGRTAPSFHPDTTHVASPTGERQADRASILAALAGLRSGSTIREEWYRSTSGTAFRRVGYAGFKRNVAVAIENWLHLHRMGNPTPRCWGRALPSWRGTGALATASGFGCRGAIVAERLEVGLAVQREPPLEALGVGNPQQRDGLVVLAEQGRVSVDPPAGDPQLSQPLAREGGAYRGGHRSVVRRR
jgi:hypothetical protein